ncbi:MAG: type II toxin-antitoxin system HicB family antitoxin, partial [Lachnospiraceae bacterium]|nr:type II toxin-antitoxin system HicB family antitoxin [Lachnospiraceae bacterium]
SCKDITAIEKEFHAAVDDYLEFCTEVGKEPDKEYKGTFNVRIEPELHKKLATKAFQENESLNTTVEKAIRAYLSENSQSSIQEETILILSTALASQRINTQQNNWIFDKESTYAPTSPYDNLIMLYNEKGMTN